MVKGTSTGTVADIEGKYSLSVPESAKILVVSFIGMKTMEVAITGSQVDAQMQPDILALDEIVVVGYGTMKKSDLTGAVTSMNMKDLPPQANLNVIQALQGYTPGINVEARGGAGAEPDLNVRGQTSLSASDRPLIVLNGIIYNGSINDINVNDVETIDILKDASAAAVYGARSANGVIIVTTKKGATEKPTISFNAYYGVQDMTNNPMRVMNGEEYAMRLVDYYYQQDLYQWYYTNPTSEAGRPAYPDISDRTVVASRLRTQEEKDNYIAGNEIDWVDEATQVAPIQQYNLSYSGKSDRTSYYISGSYVNEEGILLNDAFSRLTFQSNVESKVNDWLTIGAISSYSYRDYSGIESDLWSARRASPLADNKIGPNFDTYLTGELYMPYPMANLYADNSDIRNNFNLVGRTSITVPWVQGLSWNMDFSNNYFNRNNFEFYPVNTPDGAAQIGRGRKRPSEQRNLLLNNIISYANSFGVHGINATLLYSRENRISQDSDLEALQFDNPILGYNALELGTTQYARSGAWQETNLAYMARLNYTYNNRYLVTATVRKDGFSGFGADNKFATFPSLSVGWVLSEEDFINTDGVYLKLRASYGVNGNQGIGRYSSLSRMSTTAYAFGSSTSIGVYPNTLGNSNLAWEKTASLNLGIDYGFLNDKVSGSLEIYQAQTSDVLVRRALPIMTGYANVWTNIGGIENKGIELSLKSINMQNSEFRWTSNFSFSLNRNKITKLYGDENDSDIGNGWFVGESIGAIYDYEVDGGLWTEADLFSGNIMNNWYPGQYKYKDLNNDGVIDKTNDRKIIGYRDPAYRFSINNILTYKNFSLFFFINSAQGGKRYFLQNNDQVVNVDWNADTFYRQNASAVRQYWTPENGVNNATGAYNTPVTQGGVYESRSFVRLQDISLSYDLSKSLLSNLNLQGLKIYVASKNPYTITSWSGWDPEFDNENNDTRNNPVMRNYTIGLNISL